MSHEDFSSHLTHQLRDTVLGAAVVDDEQIDLRIVQAHQRTQAIRKLARPATRAQDHRSGRGRSQRRRPRCKERSIGSVRLRSENSRAGGQARLDRD